MEDLTFWIGDAVCQAVADAGLLRSIKCFEANAVQELGATFVQGGVWLAVACGGAAVMMLMIRADMRTNGRPPRFVRAIAAAYDSYIVESVLVGTVAAVGISAVARLS